MTVSDIQTNKLFLSLSYLNVGEKAIKGLGVQILFYNGTRVNYILPDAKKEYYIDVENNKYIDNVLNEFLIFKYENMNYVKEIVLLNNMYKMINKSNN